MRRKQPPPPATDENIAAAQAVVNKARSSMSDFDATKAATDASRAAANTMKLEETEALYSRLLTLLAQKRSPDAVAAAMSWTPAGLTVFLAEHRTFTMTRWAAVLKQLAENAKTPIMAPEPGSEFSWTEDSRRRLLARYIDTGDLLEAQKFVGCTPSQFNRELVTNGVFAETVKQAKKEAANTLELIATSDALKGNDKLMSLILRDKGDSDTARLTDQQIAQRITALIARVRTRLAPASSGGDDTGGAARVSGGTGGTGESAPA